MAPWDDCRDLGISEDQVLSMVLIGVIVVPSAGEIALYCDCGGRAGGLIVGKDRDDIVGYRSPHTSGGSCGVE